METNGGVDVVVVMLMRLGVWPAASSGQQRQQESNHSESFLLRSEDNSRDYGRTGTEHDETIGGGFTVTNNSNAMVACEFLFRFRSDSQRLFNQGLLLIQMLLLVARGGRRRRPTPNIPEKAGGVTRRGEGRGLASDWREGGKVCEKRLSWYSYLARVLVWLALVSAVSRRRRT
jgi:hypothetical protein